jgi:hypothetical protein
LHTFKYKRAGPIFETGFLFFVIYKSFLSLVLLGSLGGATAAGRDTRSLESLAQSGKRELATAVLHISVLANRGERQTLFVKLDASSGLLLAKTLATAGAHLGCELAILFGKVVAKGLRGGLAPDLASDCFGALAGFVHLLSAGKDGIRDSARTAARVSRNGGGDFGGHFVFFPLCFLLVSVEGLFPLDTFNLIHFFRRATLKVIFFNSFSYPLRSLINSEENKFR